MSKSATCIVAAGAASGEMASAGPSISWGGVIAALVVAVHRAVAAR